jgi:hypothetical protein
LASLERWRLWEGWPAKIQHNSSPKYYVRGCYARRRPGWRPPLTPEQQEERLAWALAHNPDKYEYSDRLGFDFRTFIFIDETLARIGEQRGMQRA